MPTLTVYVINLLMFSYYISQTVKFCVQLAHKPKFRRKTSFNNCADKNESNLQELFVSTFNHLPQPEVGKQTTQE
uniref:Uncharacterized protein n=1 Tax=Arion vulgaris TaxID=1028688 RepID=A0A0B7ACT0_9EUPU